MLAPESSSTSSGSPVRGSRRECGIARRRSLARGAGGARVRWSRAPIALLALLASVSCSGGGSSGGSGAPAVEIASPSGNAPLTGITVVSATASDPRGVAALQFRLDGADVGPRLTSPPWSFHWDTSATADGPHELSAVAWNAAQVEGRAAPVAIEVDHSTFTPSLTFATFLGGGNVESVRDVFVDAAGDVYVTGGTTSTGFPTTTGAYDRTFNGTHDVYVAKFAAGGGALVFATLLGGPNYDRAYAIEVDANGDVYVAGRAGDGFPATAGSLQTQFGGDDAPDPLYGAQDGFVARLSADGSTLLWATYFGNDSGNALRDVGVDASGNVYVAGGTDRPHFAVTPGSFDSTLSGPTDGVIAEISADGSSVVWGSYFGGSGPDGGTPSLRVAGDGTLWVLGHTQSDDFPATAGAHPRRRAGGVDLVLLAIAPGGATLSWATLFGGSKDEFSETHGLWVDATGVVTVAATTLSPDVPFVPSPIPPPFQSSYGGSGGSGTGAQTNYPGDGFVARFSADGRQLLAFTYFGGSEGDGVEGVAVDDQGRVHLSGATFSDDLQVTTDALQLAKAARADAFCARFSSDLTTLEFATFLGGGDDDFGRGLALGLDGRIVSGGTTDSSDFPTTPGAFEPDPGGGQSDGFVFEIEP
jgi:hypothetical protein